MFDSGLIWYGEIRCQSLLGLKGLILQALSILLEEMQTFFLCYVAMIVNLVQFAVSLLN